LDPQNARDTPVTPYPDIKHEQPVEEGVEEEGHDHGRLRQLQPWYPQLRQPEEKGAVYCDPFQKEPEGLCVFLDQLGPVVELPSEEGGIEAKGVETLCRGVENV
jgi:hypothetical protein